MEREKMGNPKLARHDKIARTIVAMPQSQKRGFYIRLADMPQAPHRFMVTRDSKTDDTGCWTLCISVSPMAQKAETMIIALATIRKFDLNFFEISDLPGKAESSASLKNKVVPCAWIRSTRFHSMAAFFHRHAFYVIASNGNYRQKSVCIINRRRQRLFP
ncbi:MAG: hypothetical protein RRZ24_08305 [Clostridia bacterium]